MTNAGEKDGDIEQRANFSASSIIHSSYSKKRIPDFPGTNQMWKHSFHDQMQKILYKNYIKNIDVILYLSTEYKLINNRFHILEIT